jgi:hypothetical protein
MTSRLWYRADLNNGLVAANNLTTIREQFAAAVGAAGWPDGACLFLVAPPRRRGSARKDGEETGTICFSPSAIAAMPHLIAACGAEPGPPPDRAYARLLVGNETDWDLLPRPAH